MEDRRSPKKRNPVDVGAKDDKDAEGADTPGDLHDEIEPDFPGVETDEDDNPRLDKLEEYVQIGQIHGKHTLDPVTTIHDISHMAGYGGDGFDSIEGIDSMVMGDVDATGELETPSATEGSPLELDPYESIFADDAGFGDMTLAVPGDDEQDTGDWTSHFEIREEETLV